MERLKSNAPIMPSQLSSSRRRLFVTRRRAGQAKDARVKTNRVDADSANQSAFADLDVGEPGPMREYGSPMLIRIGYDIRFEIGQPVPIIALLSVHPSRRAYLKAPDGVRMDPHVGTEEYTDTFGNICTRISAPAGTLRLTNSTRHRGLRVARGRVPNERARSRSRSCPRRQFAS